MASNKWEPKPPSVPRSLKRDIFVLLRAIACFFKRFRRPRTFWRY